MALDTSGFVSLFMILGVLISEASSVTPVEKVKQLLVDLRKKVDLEGKDEAIAYDKYSCFCKEQADNKLYAIETSAEKITHLDAQINKLATEITNLDSEISDLGLRIDALSGQITNENDARETERQAFLTEVANVTGAIDAVERAIQAVKNSKNTLAGKVELEASALTQVRSAARAALSSPEGLSGSEVDHLTFLTTAADPYIYKYHANDIIATLQNLQGIFTKRKAQLEEDEFRVRAAHELKVQSLGNEKSFAEKDRKEKEEVRESKAEDKEAAENDKNQETLDKTSDTKFLEVLKTDCEAKGSLWDQRSTSRAAEITAISEALRALESGVAPNWSANKKLVGLQQSNAKGHWVYVADSAPSFLQFQGVRLRGTHLRGVRAEAQCMDKVHHLLSSLGAKYKSPVLSVAALKVRAAEDHFVKVRQIIKDLLQRLSDQATAEASAKTLCDTGMSAAVAKRDTEHSKMEDITAQIAIKQSTKDQLLQEIAALSQQIAQNKKSLLEATQLRQEEKVENAKTVDDAGVGRQEVKFAIDTLKAYYSTFFQRSAYVPPDSDRSGLTVGDRAPEIFDSEYKGAVDASKGIISLLEVIYADFDRTGTAVSSDETAAESKFQTFKSTNEADTSTKEGTIATKKASVLTIEDELVALEDSLTDAKTQHELANSDLEGLHSMCVAGEETYAERVAHRQKEIEALKEAHDILENWQK